MKKMLLMSILVLSQISFAQVKERARMTSEQSRARVEKSSIYKEIEKAHEAGKDIMNDPALKASVGKVIELTLKDVVSLSARDINDMGSLLNVSPLEIMTEVGRLSSIVKATTGVTPAEKINAKKTLELMVIASKTVETTAHNEAEASKQKAKIADIIKVSEKIANLNLAEKSEKFTKLYEKALAEGKSVEEAVKIASEGKFDLKKLLDCV